MINYLNEDYTDPQTGEALFIENVFVFAYSLSSFNPSKEDDADNFNANDKDVYDMLIHLQQQIDAFNEEAGELKARLFIVDVDHSNNENIFTDSVFGGNNEVESAGYLFSYINFGELVTDPINIRGKKYTLNYLDSGASTTIAKLRTAIGQAANFVADGCVIEE